MICTDVEYKRAQSGNTKTPTPVLAGPVENLEDYVRADWWRQIFNSNYLKTDGDVVADESITKSEVDSYVEILSLTRDDLIMDLCCGQGRHTVELAQRGFNVTGFDRSRYLIKRGRSEAKLRGLGTRFKEGDARKLTFSDDRFNVVLLLGNSFGYFESVTDDLCVLREVIRVLAPWGRILIQVSDGEWTRHNFQPRSWEWIGPRQFVCRERSLSADQTRLISREVITDSTMGIIADQFYAQRLYSRNELFRLLNESGFSDIAFHGEMRPKSQRNQDLGMMEQCILVSGRVRKQWNLTSKRKSARSKDITVLFGDPSRPDPLKPSAIFDDDDFYTIDRLKSALNSLDDYHFVYLSEHDRLIDSLRKLRGKTDLVFNLCDEGFYNDARRELHIPALLEVLGIPYTGSPPQCLAYCYDKSLVRGIVNEMGILISHGYLIQPGQSMPKLERGFPLIVKPNCGDSSFGINSGSVADSAEAVIDVIATLRSQFGDDKPILLEEYLPGKDLSVGIIGNYPGKYTVLPIVEEDYSSVPSNLPRICGYEAKWLPESPYGSVRSIPANLPDEVVESITEDCLQVFQRLGCRDYCRFDWRLDKDGRPRLLEVNPNPGWCWDGHLARMAQLAGMTYGEFLRSVLIAAEERNVIC